MNNNEWKKYEGICRNVSVLKYKLAVVGKPICPLSIAAIVGDVHFYGTKIHRQ